MLCYITLKEHLGLPNAEDVRNGIIAYKIAAHSADIARGRKGARDIDDAIVMLDINLTGINNFELSLDPDRAKSITMKLYLKMYLKMQSFVQCVDQNLFI